MGNGTLSRGYSGMRVKLTSHLHLVPRLRMVVLQFYSTSSWRDAKLINPRDKFYS
jgi:hypothetical protein